jgi:hypothetical protein
LAHPGTNAFVSIKIPFQNRNCVNIGRRGVGLNDLGTRLPDKMARGPDRVMGEHGDLTLDPRDRALLRAILAGSALRQIAGSREQTDDEVRAELRRLLHRIRNRRQALPADRGRPAHLV